MGVFITPFTFLASPFVRETTASPACVVLCLSYSGDRGARPGLCRRSKTDSTAC